jgi:exopolysaccharide biosynthesis polyprenyl glycosylphosphotransferase
LLRYYGLYESHRVEGVTQMIRSLLSSLIVALGGAVLAATAAGMFDRAWDAARIFTVSGAILLTYRLLVYGALRWARARGFDCRQVCVIGDCVKPDLLQSKFSGNASWGLNLAYWIHAPGEGVVQAESTFQVHDFLINTAIESSLPDLLKDHHVDEVLIWTDTERVQDFRSIWNACRECGIATRLVLRDSQFLFQDHLAAAADTFGGEIALSVGGGDRNAPGSAVKRLLDVAVSLCLIVALAPLLLLIALLVKLSSPGPILFIQPRMGRNGRVFGIWKFRTMVDGAEVLLPALAARNITEGIAFKSRDDWRVTPVGRWLRRFSLDELPQLFNVVHGTMSLVGPRPLPVREAVQVAGAFRRRFSVRPGITCLWQVNGRSDVTFGRWMSMDLEYVDGWSLWLDAKLLMRTIPAVLSGRGSY